MLTGPRIFWNSHICVSICARFPSIKRPCNTYWLNERSVEYLLHTQTTLALTWTRLGWVVSTGLSGARGLFLQAVPALRGWDNCLLSKASHYGEFRRDSAFQLNNHTGHPDTPTYIRDRRYRWNIHCQVHVQTENRILPSACKDKNM